jgi:hypothetical protein
VRPTQPPIQWVPGVLFPWLKRGRGVTLTTHTHVVQRSRNSRSYIFSPLVAYMAVAGQLYFYTEPRFDVQNRQCRMKLEEKQNETQDEVQFYFNTHSLFLPGSSYFSFSP